jgi:RNA polymerase sigma-70 factor (ECF subfamily)
VPLGERFDDVLAAARAGGEAAWRALYEDLAPILRGYLGRQGARDVDDLVGDVWLRVVRSLERFDGDEGAFRSWVFTIAHHRLIDQRRQRGRRSVDPAETADLEAALPEAPDTAELAVEARTSEEIAALLGVLTDDQRDVLLLRLAGLTVVEVAEVVGRTPNATKALQRRGLRSLERHLAATGHPYPSGAAGR